MSNETTPSTEASTETPSTEAPKRTRQVIYNDGQGKEIFRKDKKQGRNPRGSVVQANGDVVVPNCALGDNGEPVLPAFENTKEVPQLIDLDAEGNIVAKKVKGRGRPPCGYVKEESGEFAGHHVKRHQAEVADTSTESQIQASNESESTPEPVAGPLQPEAVVATEEEAVEAIEADTEQWEDAPDNEVTA
tara:strand:- start:166 stop:735 length:570 start_codon:yes stop_codon:yes gene_type:complete